MERKTLRNISESDFNATLKLFMAQWMDAYQDLGIPPYAWLTEDHELENGETVQVLIQEKMEQYLRDIIHLFGHYTWPEIQSMWRRGIREAGSNINKFTINILVEWMRKYAITLVEEKPEAPIPTPEEQFELWLSGLERALEHESEEPFLMMGKGVKEYYAILEEAIGPEEIANIRESQLELWLSRVSGLTGLARQIDESLSEFGKRIKRVEGKLGVRIPLLSVWVRKEVVRAYLKLKKQ